MEDIGRRPVADLRKNRRGRNAPQPRAVARGDLPSPLRDGGDRRPR